MSEGPDPKSKWRAVVNEWIDRPVTEADASRFLVGMIEDNERLEAETDALQSLLSKAESDLAAARATIAELVEALRAEQNVQDAASDCENCDGGEYCEVHMEQAVQAATLRNRALHQFDKKAAALSRASRQEKEPEP